MKIRSDSSLGLLVWLGSLCFLVRVIIACIIFLRLLVHVHHPGKSVFVSLRVLSGLLFDVEEVFVAIFNYRLTIWVRASTFVELVVALVAPSSALMVLIITPSATSASSPASCGILFVIEFEILRGERTKCLFVSLFLLFTRHRSSSTPSTNSSPSIFTTASSSAPVTSVKEGV